MTPEERAFCEEIRSAAFALIGAAGNIEIDALAETPKNVLQAARANKVSLGLLAIVAKASARLGAAELAEDAAKVQAADYDLAALATAPASPVKE